MEVSARCKEGFHEESHPIKACIYCACFCHRR